MEVRTAGPTQLDGVLGAALVGDRPVRDRAMAPEAERLLREWFAAPDVGAVVGGVSAGAGGAFAPVSGFDSGASRSGGTPSPRAGPSPAWSAPLRVLVDAGAAVRAPVPAVLLGPEAVAGAQVWLQQLGVLR